MKKLENISKSDLSFVCYQNKIKVVALKITNNINVLIKVRWWSHTQSDTNVLLLKCFFVIGFLP